MFRNYKFYILIIGKVCFKMIKYKYMRTIIFYIVLFSVLACTNTNQVNKRTVSKGELQALISTDFHINGMTCTGCEKTITTTVKSIDGVKDVTASYIDSLATVTFDSTMTTTAMISQKINDLGYNVVSTTPRNKVN